VATYLDVKDMAFLFNPLNGFRFRKFYRALCDQTEEFSEAKLAGWYKTLAMPNDQFFAKGAGMDVEFGPLLRRFLGDDVNRIDNWLDSPNRALYGHTPRYLRSLPRGKHAFRQFAMRFSELG
jgi:hypothetical protein